VKIYLNNDIDDYGNVNVFIFAAAQAFKKDPVWNTCIVVNQFIAF
jgi:hypothetical protein